MSSSSSRKQCPYCKLSYAFQSSLSKHIANKHKEESKVNDEESCAGRGIICSTCSVRFTTLLKLIDHQNQFHGEEITVRELSFTDMNEFHAWKKHEEESSKSLYVQHSASRMQGFNRKTYYYCNRSGYFKRKGNALRELKVQGTSKVGGYCTAHVTVSEDTITKKVTVWYCNQHRGHELEICHLAIPEETKLDIAAKLQSGVSIERIMDDIRDDMNGDVKRQHLINRRDILNVRNSLNLHSIEKHRNDHISTAAWVKEMQSMEYNPVLIFKNQGEPQGIDCDNLATSDFILGLQTEYQRDMMIKYGRKAICMDETHGTNSYDFKLVTVLVIDSHGEGIPVAWCLSNRTDSTVLMEFLKPLKERVGLIDTEVLMSDMADNFLNAWIGVFGRCNTKHLYCTWHVDKAWRKGLNIHIKNNEDKIKVYHCLRVLLQETDEAAFQVKLQQLLSYLLVEYPDFYTYFNETYVPITAKWAYCFRVRAGINTNMFVEAFHRKLKTVYLDNKQNRRVDKLLFTLLKLSRDMIL